MCHDSVLSANQRLHLIAGASPFKPTVSGLYRHAGMTAGGMTYLLRASGLAGEVPPIARSARSLCQESGRRPAAFSPGVPCFLTARSPSILSSGSRPIPLCGAGSTSMSVLVLRWCGTGRPSLISRCSLPSPPPASAWPLCRGALSTSSCPSTYVNCGIPGHGGSICWPGGREP